MAMKNTTETDFYTLTDHGSSFLGLAPEIVWNVGMYYARNVNTPAADAACDILGTVANSRGFKAAEVEYVYMMLDNSADSVWYCVADKKTGKSLFAVQVDYATGMPIYDNEKVVTIDSRKK